MKTPGPWNEGMSLKDKVHRVYELEGELSMLKADYADCNRERARWKAQSDALLSALKNLTGHCVEAGWCEGKRAVAITKAQEVLAQAAPTPAADRGEG